MHTLAKNQHHNTRLIKFFIKKAYEKNPSIEDLTVDNIINGTQLSELAVSRLSGIPLCEHGEHRDLSDNSDVKTATVQERPYKSKGKNSNKMLVRYYATVSRVDTKIGMLRCIVYNPQTEKWHYFLIPPSAYYNVKDIRIAFHKTEQEPVGKYAKFEVPNFEGICKRKTLRDEIDEIMCSMNKKNVEECVEKVMDIIKQKINLN